MCPHHSSDLGDARGEVVTLEPAIAIADPLHGCNKIFQGLSLTRSQPFMVGQDELRQMSLQIRHIRRTSKIGHVTPSVSVADHRSDLRLLEIQLEEVVSFPLRHSFLQSRLINVDQHWILPVQHMTKHPSNPAKKYIDLAVKSCFFWRGKGSKNAAEFCPPGVRGPLWESYTN